MNLFTTISCQFENHYVLIIFKAETTIDELKPVILKRMKQNDIKLVELFELLESLNATTIGQVVELDLNNRKFGVLTDLMQVSNFSVGPFSVFFMIYYFIISLFDLFYIIYIIYFFFIFLFC